jgi:hypothetical protein
VLKWIVIALLMATPASAGPAIGAAASAAWAWLTGTIVGKIVLGVALSAIAQFFMGKPASPESVRELQRPNSRPPKRFVYGHTRTYGSWAPVGPVKGRILYGCMILNSRPSAGNFSLYLDKREVEFTGDPYDFAGAGASATNDPFAGRVTFWIGRGEQTSPPATILSQAGDTFTADDGWRGLTVIWLRLDAGPSDDRAERWPRVPPEVQVEGDWSLVWDLRDNSQDPDDPTTWKFSANQDLCLLDMLRQNPVRQFPLSSLHLPSFIDGANVADEVVEKMGGVEPRYQVNGTLIFAGDEIETHVAPLEIAGAGRLCKIGGRTAYVPGVARAPEYTVTDVLDGDPLRYRTLVSSRDLPRAVQASYVNPDRDWQLATLIPQVVPGGASLTGGSDGVRDVDLSMVTSPTQAMRIQKIIAMRLGSQRQITCVLPPDAFQLAGGTVVTVNFPTTYAPMNGLYEVESTRPGLSAGDDDGVFMRVPVEMSEYSDAHYAWDPIVDQQPVANETFVVSWSPLAPPENLDAEQSTNGGDISLRFFFEPSPSGAVIDYEWQYRETGGDYSAGGFINADVRDGADKVFGHAQPVEATVEYDIRVRSIAPGRASAWVEITEVEA